VFTWVQCCPIAIDGGHTDADGETVHAADTPLQLHFGARASARVIARTVGVGRSTVQDYLARTAAAGLVWPLPPELTDEALEQLLFPAPCSKPGARRYIEPDWSALVREMKRPGVNLTVLFEEYQGVHPDGYAYSRFCQLYRAFERRLSPTMRQTHVAGDVGKRFPAAVTALDRLALLVWPQFGRSAHLLPPCNGPRPAFAGPVPDQVALKLRQATEHGQHQSPVRRGGIRPGIAEGPEACLAGGDCCQRVQQVAGGSWIRPIRSIQSRMDRPSATSRLPVRTAWTAATGPDTSGAMRTRSERI
jgi:hypothetical protein